MTANWRLTAWEWWFNLLGLSLVVVGYLGPWIPHKTAALAVTGMELAEFAKFFPQLAHITRPFFYLPFVVGVIFFSLLVGRSSVCLLRWGTAFGAAVLLLLTLVPYPVIEQARHALTSDVPFTLGPQYTQQLILVAVGGALTLLTPLGRCLSRRAWAVVIATLTLVGVIPALLQFARLRPLVGALYGAPLGLGWGIGVCVVGFALLLFDGISVVCPLRSSVSVAGKRS